MPAQLSYFLQTATLPRFRPTWLAGGALILLTGGVWSIVGGHAAASGPAVRPLYPAQAPVVEMTDATQYTAAQVVEGLPAGLRFELLLKRTGVMQEITGEGPYTVLVPANNYFDYFPGGVSALSRADEHSLAEAHVLPHAAVVPTGESAGTYLTLAGDTLPVEVHADGTVSVGSGFAIRGYYAQNGVVYLISKVLVPDSAPAP